MAQRFIKNKPVVLDGSNVSDVTVIPKGTKRFLVNPRTTSLTVQVSFEATQANTVPNFFSLIGGQSLELEFPDGTVDDMEVCFYAATALTVDLVWW